MNTRMTARRPAGRHGDLVRGGRARRRRGSAARGLPRRPRRPAHRAVDRRRRRRGRRHPRRDRGAVHHDRLATSSSRSRTARSCADAPSGSTPRAASWSIDGDVETRRVGGRRRARALTARALSVGVAAVGCRRRAPQWEHDPADHVRRQAADAGPRRADARAARRAVPRACPPAVLVGARRSSPSRARSGYFYGNLPAPFENWMLLTAAAVVVLLPRAAALPVVVVARLHDHHAPGASSGRGIFGVRRRELSHVRGYTIQERRGILQRMWGAGTLTLSNGVDQPLRLANIPSVGARARGSRRPGRGQPDPRAPRRAAAAAGAARAPRRADAARAAAHRRGARRAG